MKRNWISCEVVQDLLPLYEDDCCSEQSKIIVEQHLKECEDCGKKYHQYEEKLPQIMEAEVVDAKKIQRGMRKIQRWKIMGIVILCLVLVTVFVAVPAWNHIYGEGITYSNLKAVKMAYGFEKALASGDYEGAYSYLDIEGLYNDLLSTSMTPTNSAVMEGIEKVEVNGFEWYNAVAKEKFTENIKTLEEMNEMVSSYKGFRILKNADSWTVHFDHVKTTSGQEIEMQLDIYPDGIRGFHTAVNYVPIDRVTDEMTMNDAVAQKELMLSRLYISPTINETVMEILYGETEYEWEKLFEY